MPDEFTDEHGQAWVRCHCCGGAGYGTTHGSTMSVTGPCLCCCRNEQPGFLRKPGDEETARLWAVWLSAWPQRVEASEPPAMEEEGAPDAR